MFWCYENGDGNLAVASVTMCNDDIRNYNSKISDLGYLTSTSLRQPTGCLWQNSNTIRRGDVR